MNTNSLLNALDNLTAGVPYTPDPICHLLFHLVKSFNAPKIVEIASGYGKATVYLGAAAKAQGGKVWSVDLNTKRHDGRSAVDLVQCANVADACEIALGKDARWFLLELLSEQREEWIHVAYLDASHTVEIDSFCALALWTHLRVGGFLVLDDLDWIPNVHGVDMNGLACPDRGNVRAIYDYLKELSNVRASLEYGRERFGWTWGILQKGLPEAGSHQNLSDQLRHFEQFHES